MKHLRCETEGVEGNFLKVLVPARMTENVILKLLLNFYDTQTRAV